MTAASLSFRSPLPTRPIISTRSSSRLLMAVLFNRPPPGWRSQSKGTFLKSSGGDIIIKFQQADVAAFLIIAFHLHNPPVVTWGAVKGAREQGAFILTLDSSPRHLQSSWERSATQFSWASFFSGFGLCPVFCVNDQALFLGLRLFLGMGCKGRGHFPFPCISA